MKTTYMPHVMGISLSLFIAGIGWAQVDGTWKAGAGSGEWHDSAKWDGNPNPVPGGAGSEVNLTTGTGGSVWITINGSVASRTVGVLNFGATGEGVDTSWTVAASNSGTLTFDNGLSPAEINVVNAGTNLQHIRTPIILSSSLIINNDNANKTIKLGTGVDGYTISGTGGITKEGAGILELYTAPNSAIYSGDTVINGGKLLLTAQAFNGASTHLHLNNGSILESSITSLSFGGGLTINNGTINATASSLYFKNQTVTVNQGAIHAIIKDDSGSNPGSIHKVGSGTFVLSKVNTYTGNTTVSAGTLVISSTGSINGTSGTVIINGGDLRYNSAANLNKAVTFTSGTLSGTNWNGTLNNLTIGTGQTINPGNSPGTATTSNQTWATGGTYAWEINDAAGTPGADPGWDLLNGAGTLNITATDGNEFTIKVTSLTLANTAGNAVNFDDTLDYQWRIADFANAITFDAAAFNIDTNAFSNAFTGAFSLRRGDDSLITGGDNTQLWLAYTAIPEPSAWMLLVVSLGTLALRRGRRVS